ncbi:potassium channel family protein [Shimia sp. SDUM112013]|uniref:potassium channel family protein n=1 Tax=Shimia sp. SDUM112013 TaxID=3136160 RepID=UPI0032EE7464
MTLTMQILWGSLFLALCAVIHVVAIAVLTGIAGRMAGRMSLHGPLKRLIVIVGAAFLWITLSHTIQVWIWSNAFLLMGVIDDLNSALYFALVTYSTVGYGDYVLGPGTRIFGTMAGVSGVLTLGVSTAFLVALLGRLLPQTDPGGLPPSKS